MSIGEWRNILRGLFNQYLKMTSHEYLKFFMVDYFYDSKIVNISKEIFTANNNTIVDGYLHYWPELCVKSMSIDLVMQVLGYDHLGMNKDMKDKILYKIVFQDCKYFSLSQHFQSVYDDFGYYGKNRIKNSHLKQQINQKYHGDFYNIRISTSIGYIDIIFRDVKIYGVPKDEFGDEILLLNFNRYFEERDNSEIIKAMENYKNALGEKEKAFKYLIYNTDANLIDISKKIILEGCDVEQYDDIWFHSLDILNEQGTSSELEFLNNLYYQCMCNVDSESLFIRSEIGDVIDNIMYKCKSGNERMK